MATNNYITIRRGIDERHVFFDDRDRGAILRALDEASKDLAELGSSMNAVLHTGRDGIVEAVIFRACSNIPLPIVGELRPMFNKRAS